MLSEHFEKQLRANPDQKRTIVVTLHPDANEESVRSVPGVEPFEGLTGLYKASLSGKEILQLDRDEAVQAIEPDDLTFETQ